MKKYILAVLVLFTLVATRIYDPWLTEVVRLKYFDFLERKQEQLVDESIVLVNIDEQTIRRNGQWPWPRDVVATLIAEINNRGAAVVVAPIIFSEEDRFGKDQDLVNTLKADNVILAQVPTTQTNEPYARPRGSVLIGPSISDIIPSWSGALPPIRSLAETAAGVGMIATVPEPDGVVRRSPMLVAVGDRFYPSITLETIRVIAGEQSFQVRSNEAGVEIIRIPGLPLIYTDINGRVWPTRNFNYNQYSAASLPDSLEGKIVILSLTAEGFSNPVATSHGEMLPNLVIATELTSILNQMFVTRTDIADLIEIVAGIILGIIILLFVIRTKLVIAGAATLLIAIGIIYATLLARSDMNLLYDASFLLLACLATFAVSAFSRALEEFRLKQQIKKQFGTYLSPAMVEKLQKNPDLLKLGGETRELSIMFTDVRGFTAISEHYGTDVQGLTKIMNRYMTAMTAKILENNGTLDKYIGDAQMAFWNAPLDDSDHAANAVRTALAMLKDLERFNNEITTEGIPPFGMGLGINTGTVVVGNMGSTQRFDYTCLGDNVNLAARLEGQSKPYGVRLVIGQNTNELIKDKFFTVELDYIAVKGKKEGIKIYTVIEEREELQSKLFTERELHNKMMAYYRSRAWDQAIAMCKTLTSSFGGQMKEYYPMWIERCQELKRNDPGSAWDAVYRATSK
jgi:adenylate cyclase